MERERLKPKYDRRTKQKRAWKVYTGQYKDLVSNVITTRHGGNAVNPLENLGIGTAGNDATPTKADELETYNKPTRNVLRRVAGLQSVMYTKPPRRRTVDGIAEIDEFLRQGIHNLDPTLESIHNRTNGIGDWFVMPWFAPDRKVHLEMIEPWLVEEEIDRGFVVSLTVANEDGTFTKWFHDGKFEVFKEEDGGRVIVESGDSGYGVNPVVWFRLEPVGDSDPWSIQRVLDLVEGTVDIGAEECYHKHNSYLRSFNVIGMGDNAEGLPVGDKAHFRIGNKQVLPFSLTGEPLADPSDPFEATVTKMEHNLAATRGISPRSYDGDAETSDHNRTVSQERREHYKAQVKIFAEPERQLLRACLGVAKEKGLIKGDPAAEIMIDYVPPAVNIDDEKKTHDLLVAKMKTGLDSPVEYVLRNNPEFKNRKQAETWISQNLEDKAENHRLSREHNQNKGLPDPFDIADAGKGPKENGADGGRKKAALAREMSGGNGPREADGPVLDAVEND